MSSPFDAEALRPATDPARSRILRGGADAFARLGYGGTSVESILEASGVSRRTFYKKFRSKDDVLVTLLQRSVQMLADAVEQVYTSAPDRAAAMPAAVDAYLRVQADAGPLARVLLQERFAPDSVLEEARQAAAELFRAQIAAEVALRTGETPDPILVAGVSAGIDQICIQMATEYPQGDWDTERAKAAILRVLSALR